LLDEDSGYHQMSWEVLVSFQGLYAAKIYLHVCPYMGGKKKIQPPPLSTAALRELLGVPAGAYPPGASGRFHTLIQQACAAVTKSADGFAVEYLRTGRAASAQHWFRLQPAAKQARLPLHKMARKTPSADTTLLRERITKAMEALPAPRRVEVETILRSQGYTALSDDPQELRAYGGALRGLGVL
jgi:hypothetical protein